MWERLDLLWVTGNLFAYSCFWCDKDFESVGGKKEYLEKTHAGNENMQTTHRNMSQERCCCEATVQRNTALPPGFHFCFIVKPHKTWSMTHSTHSRRTEGIKQSYKFWGNGGGRKEQMVRSAAESDVVKNWNSQWLEKSVFCLKYEFWGCRWGLWHKKLITEEQRKYWRSV